MSFMSLMLSGGDWVIWGLIACSVAMVAILIERWVLLRKEQESFRSIQAAVLKHLEEGPTSLEKVLDAHHGCAVRILRSGFTRAQHGAAGVEDLLAAASWSERHYLERRLLVLGTLGNNAPFIGLFGTVLGVIKAFHDLSANAGAGPEAVMQGLSEALIATAVGLFVAIPCVVAYNYFQKQVKDFLAGAESLNRLLLARLKTQ